MNPSLDSARPALEWKTLAKGAAVVAVLVPAVVFGPSVVALSRGLDVLTALLMGVLLLNVAAGAGLILAALASHLHDLYHTHDAPPPSGSRPLLVRAPHPRLPS